jgi:hypothetical protein
MSPTFVFDSYWKFAAERQRIYQKRLRGEPQPWTADPILSAYKFTNVFRAADTVSRYLIRNVIYHPDASTEAEEVGFRAGEKCARGSQWVIREAEAFGKLF